MWMSSVTIEFNSIFFKRIFSEMYFWTLNRAKSINITFSIIKRKSVFYYVQFFTIVQYLNVKQFLSKWHGYLSLQFYRINTIQWTDNFKRWLELHLRLVKLRNQSITYYSSKTLTGFQKTNITTSKSNFRMTNMTTFQISLNGLN